MGNKTVGREVDRSCPESAIETPDFSHFPRYEDDPLKFFETRINFRESLESWGYLWAHRLLEDAFIRPNYDMKSLNTIKSSASLLN